MDRCWVNFARGEEGSICVYVSRWYYYSWPLAPPSLYSAQTSSPCSFCGKGHVLPRQYWERSLKCTLPSEDQRAWFRPFVSIRFWRYLKCPPSPLLFFPLPWGMHVPARGCLFTCVIETEVIHHQVIVVEPQPPTCEVRETKSICKLPEFWCGMWLHSSLGRNYSWATRTQNTIFWAWKRYLCFK